MESPIPIFRAGNKELDALLPRLDGREDRPPRELAEQEDQPGEHQERPGAQADVDVEQLAPARALGAVLLRPQRPDWQRERETSVFCKP